MAHPARLALLLAIMVAALAVFAAVRPAPEDSARADNDTLNKENRVVTDRIHKTDEEWRKELTPEEYDVTRRGGTEPPFTGKYYNFHKDGVFRCVCCGAVLFDSDTKFNSGSGWPSFYAPDNDTTLELVTDHSLGMIRTEVRCRRCGAHLGHLFDDGPQPTGLRYCINSAALQFQADSTKTNNPTKQEPAE